MAIVEGGAIGLDEGAIFSSLQDPVWKKTTIKYRHNKDGLVTSETTTTFCLTGSMVLLMVTIGGVTMALDAIDEIRDEVSFRGVISKIVWPF